MCSLTCKSVSRLRHHNECTVYCAWIQPDTSPVLGKRTDRYRESLLVWCLPFITRALGLLESPLLDFFIFYSTCGSRATLILCRSNALTTLFYVACFHSYCYETSACGCAIAAYEFLFLGERVSCILAISMQCHVSCVHDLDLARTAATRVL